MKLVIFGPPGSGKGTYSARLAPLLDIPHISTGDIFREEIKKKTKLGKQVATYVEKGDLVPDEIVTKVLRKRIGRKDCKRGFILDGYPRTLQQLKDLNQTAKIDLVINLVVPDWIIVKRLSSREVCKNCGAIYNTLTLKPKITGKCDKCGGELYQREDDKPEVIKQRLKIYKKQIEPLLKYYKKNKQKIFNVAVKDLLIPPEVVVEKILKRVKRLTK